MASGGVVGRAVVQIVGDNTQLRASMAQSQAMLRQFGATANATATRSIAPLAQRMAVFGRNLDRFGITMQSLGRTMTTYLTLPVVGLGYAATRMALDFNKAMTRVKALSQPFWKDLGISVTDVKDRIMQLSGQTAQAPVDLANALYFVASAGLNANQVMPVLAASARGAATGMGDLGDIASQLTSILNDYKESGLTAATAMDILTEAIRQGKAEPADFAAGIGTLAPQASRMGISFQDLAAALAAATNAGVPAARAITGLRYLIATFADPTDKAIEVLNNYGFSVGEVQKRLAEPGGLLATLQMLAKQFDLTTVKGKAAWSDVIGGVRGRIVADTLVTGNLEKIADLWDAIAESAEKGSTTFEDAWAKVRSSKAQQFAQAWQDIKNALLDLGQRIIPILKNDVLPVISDAVTWFTNLSGTTKEIIIWTGAIAAAVGPLMLLVGTLARLVALPIRGAAGLLGFMGTRGAAAVPAVAGAAPGLVAAAPGALTAAEAGAIGTGAGILGPRVIQAGRAFRLGPSGLLVPEGMAAAAAPGAIGAAQAAGVTGAPSFLGLIRGGAGIGARLATAGAGGLPLSALLALYVAGSAPTSHIPQGQLAYLQQAMGGQFGAYPGEPQGPGFLRNVFRAQRAAQVYGQPYRQGMPVGLALRRTYGVPDQFLGQAGQFLARAPGPIGGPEVLLARRIGAARGQQRETMMGVIQMYNKEYTAIKRNEQAIDEEADTRFRNLLLAGRYRAALRLVVGGELASGRAAEKSDKAHKDLAKTNAELALKVRRGAAAAKEAGRASGEAARGARKAGDEAQTAKGKFEGYKTAVDDVPKAVSTKVNTPGLPAALAGLRNLNTQAALAERTVDLYLRVHRTGGFGGPVEPSVGGISRPYGSLRGNVVSGPQWRLVGEGSYHTFAGRGAEAILPLDSRGIGILSEALRRAGGRGSVNVYVQGKVERPEDLDRQLRWLSASRGL